MMNIVESFKALPTLFVLSGSPFQAMCMIEAIHTFEIRDYKVLLCLSHSELPRKKQVEELLKKSSITYNIESVDFKITKAERLKTLIPDIHKYKLAFVGDCNNELLIFKAFRYISDGGTIVYLDDGIATIQFFNGLCQLNYKLKKYYSFLSKLRNICFDKYFFTIYHDLSDNKHQNIPNNFKHLTTHKKSCGMLRNIIVLGTCTDDYCRMERISVKDFLSAQKKLMLEIKHTYPDENIIFVPHGRDIYMETKQDCEDLGIKYQPTSISIEMYILECPFAPVAIYGYTSSALFNLNLILPQSEIVNITFAGNTPLNNRIDITSEYYARHGIRREIRYLHQ